MFSFPSQPDAPRAWPRWLPRMQVARKAKRLRLLETLPLGDRRFVAVVEVAGRQLLIGGTPHSLALLTELDDQPGGGS